MNENRLYLTIWHDRHTDDEYLAFATLEKAIYHCRAMVQRYPKERYRFEEIPQGKFCLWCSDDYNIIVREIEVVW